MDKRELERRLRKVQHLFPECEILPDGDGMYIIYTGEYPTPNPYKGGLPDCSIANKEKPNDSQL